MRPKAAMQAATIAVTLAALDDVGSVGRADPALLLDDGFGLVGGREAQIDPEHLRPFAREQHGRGLAVAPARPDRAGAGDQRHPVLETLAHAAPARSPSLQLVSETSG